MRRDYIFMLICYFIWGFQPLYFQLKSEMDGLFLLMCRIVWGCIFATGIVLMQGRGREIIEVWKDKDLMLKHLVPGAFFNFLDLAIYFFAVTGGNILATSLGYYVAPLVVCYLGILIFKEKFTWQLGAATVLILAGIAVSGSGFGSAPLISISLMFCFSLYSAFMRNVKRDAIVCTAVHLMLVAPFALAVILLARHGENGIAGVDLGTQLFLMAAGVIMVAPIILYASCVKRVPMVIMGFLQYLSPTFGFICSRIMGEKIADGQMVIFGFIWAAVLLYTTATVLRERRKQKT